jgi:hypothetical protein
MNDVKLCLQIIRLILKDDKAKMLRLATQLIEYCSGTRKRFHGGKK